jgi:hypothetical protein
MTRVVKELTTYKISEDGQSVTLKMLDELGAEAALSFGIGELGNLVMTLPGLIETALQRQLRDGSFRFAYPVGSWAIEESTDPSSLIVTLRTKDGFGVSFSMPRGNAMRLAHSLCEVEHKPAVVAH